MTPSNESNEQSLGSKGINDISRRQFLKLTGKTLVAGMTIGVGGLPRLARAGGFVDYLKYDGLGIWLS